MSDFLTKIEGFYLNILRVLILLAATIALIIFAFGLVRVAPTVFDGMSKEPPKVENASLGQFISQKRIEGTLASESDGGIEAAAPASVDAPQNIKDASALLVTYLKKVGLNAEAKGMETMLMNYQSQVSLDYQDAYGDSIKTLMQELSASKGAPLTPELLDQLISWHLEKFKAASEVQDVEKAKKSAEKTQTLLWSGVSLLAFLFLTFCFIFIKIERNLRTAKISN